jgi:hypothetical protein
MVNFSHFFYFPTSKYLENLTYNLIMKNDENKNQNTNNGQTIRWLANLIWETYLISKNNEPRDDDKLNNQFNQ